MKKKKNIEDEDAKDSAGNITSFNVNSSLKERIFARNPELVKNAFSMKEEKKEERKESEENLPHRETSVQPYRGRPRGRPKAGKRPIFEVHTDINYIYDNSMRNIDRHGDFRPGHRGRIPGSASLRLKRPPKNSKSITFNQSIINPNVNHIINSNSNINLNINHNPRPVQHPISSLIQYKEIIP